ncbi:MAG: hypothetical protein FD180_1841 [Planctomycetota bacterium]|nr:MAG: hypothetical protein FD180_1841 [Planctomycetota bacterium]
MTCIEIRERLDAFADGEDQASAEVEAHLRGCPSCEAALAELRAGLASLDAALGPVGARAEAAAARALLGMPGDRGVRVPWWGLVVATAAGFLVAMAMFKRGETVGSGMRAGGQAGEPFDSLRSLSVDGRAEERAKVAAEVERLLRTPEVGCVVEAADQKLKRLGAGCVEPAAAWVKAADVKKDAFNRRMAARVVADLAGREQAAILLEMVGDADAEVRAMANRGLIRISGVTACTEEQARESGEGARRAWEKYLGGE